jgi:hypothetical protein
MRRHEKYSSSALAFVGLISATVIAAAIPAAPAIATGSTSSISTAPRTGTDPDDEFLKKLRAAGFPESQMSDQDAIASAHKVVSWLCSDVPGIRNTVEAYLYEKHGITERDGPGGGRAFAGAALESYRGVSHGSYC